MEVETKIIYHIDDEDTPYLVKIAVPPDRVTLADFKNVLNKPNCKYFFKSMDDDFGVVKEEITDDALNLPCFNGRVVSWLVTAEGSDAGSHGSDSLSHKGSVDGQTDNQVEGGSISFHNASGETETNSMSSSQRGGRRPQAKPTTLTRHDFGPRLNGNGVKPGPLGGRHHQHLYQETANSSMMSSDLESTSYWDSDDDLTCSRFSATTETTSKSRGSRFKKRRRKHRVPPAMDRASSFSSITDSTLSLNIITVTLNMDIVNFLGISIVGQSNKGGDGGIYVGSIMKGGAVAQDGRVEPGDMILQVNEVSLENMSNDEAVGVLRDAVQKPAPIKLVVAKCWDPSPRGYFAVPRQEPVRPIDPSAWVAHTEAVRLQQHSDYGSLGPLPPGSLAPVPTGTLPLSNVNGGSLMGVPLGVASSVGGMPISRLGHGGSTSAPPGVYPPRPGPLSPSLTDLNSGSSSFNSAPEAERLYEDLNLTLNTDMTMVAKAMAMPDSGLEIRDRMWLKITIPNAFIGSEVVDWLFNRVAGFSDRRDARKYATQMLKQGFIRHTVNKSSFSEQCYYVMSPLILELCGSLSGLNIEDNLDSVSERAAATAVSSSADTVTVSQAQCRQIKNSAGVVPMSCPPTTTSYYQGPPYMMGGLGGGTSYAPPPMSYTPMPYMTENFRGDASGLEAYRGTPTNGGDSSFRGLTRGAAGVRTTGVGGSGTSVASGNSNSSSKSIESVCHFKTENGEGEDPQRVTPSAPTSDALGPDAALANDNNLGQPSKFSTSFIAAAAAAGSPTGNNAFAAATPTGNNAFAAATPTGNNASFFATSPLSPTKANSATSTASSHPPPTSTTTATNSTPQRYHDYSDSPAEAVPTPGCAPECLVDGGFSSASRLSPGGGGGGVIAGERPPTGGGVGESSPSPTPTSSFNTATSGRLKSMHFSPGKSSPSASSGNPPSYNEVVAASSKYPPKS